MWVRIFRLGMWMGLTANDSAVKYTQNWRPSREHDFPLGLPLPEGHEEVKGLWANLLSQDGDYRRKYLVRHVIDTNHIENMSLFDPRVRGYSLESNIFLKRV